MSSAILDFYKEIAAIRDDAGQRLSADPEAEPIWTTFGVTAFESPPLPEPSDGADAPDDPDGPGTPGAEA